MSCPRDRLEELARRELLVRAGLDLIAAGAPPLDVLVEVIAALVDQLDALTGEAAP